MRQATKPAECQQGSSEGQGSHQRASSKPSPINTPKTNLKALKAPNSFFAKSGQNQGYQPKKTPQRKFFANFM
ncbi:MAG: hypothetical protein EBT86_11590 [Actinobacteria bacterium]|nr:hypothetical protein [Actinomycetota bacterium]